MSPLDQLVDQLADAVADRLASRLPAAVSSPEPYLNVDQAATFIASTSEPPSARVYDLVQRGHLRPHRDGRRLLFTHDQLRTYVEGR